MTKHEWLLNRKRGIGGSEIAAVMGLSKYKTALDIYTDKINPEVTESPDNPDMKRGRDKEALVVAKFFEKHSTYAVLPESEDEFFMVWAEDRKHCFATPDRVVRIPDHLSAMQDDHCLLECKHTRRRDAYKWKTGEIPGDYYAQVQWQLYCTGLQNAYFAWIYENVEADTEEYYDILLGRDDDFIALMCEAADDFWLNSVVPKELPPGSPVSVEATTEIHDLWAELCEVQLEKKFMEEREKELKALLQAYMNDSTILAYNGRPIATWKRTKPVEKLDKALLKKQHPEAYAACMYLEEGQQRFCVKQEKREVEVDDGIF